MIRVPAVLLCLSLTACVAERLAPGPGATTPHFVDKGHWMSDDGYVLGLSEWQTQNPTIVIVAVLAARKATAAGPATR